MTVTLTKQYHALGLLWNINDNSCWHKKMAISIRLLIISRFSRTLLLNFSISIFRAGAITGENRGFQRGMAVAVGSITVAMFCLPKRTNLQAEAICSLLLLCLSNARPKLFKSEYPVFVHTVSLLVTNRIHGQQNSILKYRVFSKLRCSL
jgi:hypothetical protein